MPDIIKRESYCPHCHAPITERGMIKWDEAKKQFLVLLRAHCEPCDYEKSHLIKKLPLRIAEQSTCSCGAILKLSDHSIRRLGSDIEIEAIYVCVSCATKKASLVSRIKEGLASFWRDTTAIEIGLEGIKYEKKDGKENKDK